MDHTSTLKEEAARADERYAALSRENEARKQANETLRDIIRDREAKCDCLRHENDGLHRRQLALTAQNEILLTENERYRRQCQILANERNGVTRPQEGGQHDTTESATHHQHPEDEQVQRIEAALDTLREHFDSVLILATKRCDADSTSMFKNQCGNVYAHEGAVREWLREQEAYQNAYFGERGRKDAQRHDD